MLDKTLIKFVFFLSLFTINLAPTSPLIFLNLFITEISKSLIVCLKNTSLSITIGNGYSDLESALNCGVNYADLFVDNDKYNVYIPNNIKVVKN